MRGQKVDSSFSNTLLVPPRVACVTRLMSDRRNLSTAIGKLNMLVSIIIVNHNGKRWLKDCFGTIYCQTYKLFEVIFVDNASSDDSVDFVSKYYPKVIIIKNKYNLGFGRANNLGIKQARGEIIFFLNNDTLLKRDTLEKLLIFKVNNNFNILGPRILNYKGKDIHQGKKPSIDYTGYIGYAKKTFFIDGCALMISKKDFLYLGGFDEKYFMYSEEIDLCWRAHLFGMTIEVCNSTSIKHFAGGTGGTTQYKIKGDHEVPLFRRFEVEKNNLRNILKNYQFINLLWAIPLYEFQSLGECLVYLLTANFEAIKVVLRAHLWNLLNINDTLHQRKIIQKKRVVDDRRILSMMFFGLNKLLALRSIGLPRFK